jgi:hypothetical protein
MKSEDQQLPPYPFFAHAALLVVNSGVSIATRITALNRSGCLLSVANPLPAGESVVVKVYAWPHFFQIDGTICAHEAGHGMDVAFSKIEPQYRSPFEACLLEAQQRQRTTPIE